MRTTTGTAQRWQWRARGVVLAVVTLAASCVVAVATGAPAGAAWSAPTAGAALASAQAVPQVATPQANSTGTTVTVTWEQSLLSGGSPADGYTVSRYRLDTGVVVTVGDGCSGTVTATSCVESGVPQGSWTYTVTARLGGWTGRESHRSAGVIVSNADLTFSSSTTVTTLPTTLTGTIAGFAAGTGLTFHLDSPTGTLLNATPTTVPAGGSGTVTVAIPAGTSDDPHSVVAVGSNGVLASAPITVVDSPDRTSLVMLDVNANGKIDTVRATFDEELAPYTAGTAPWTLANVPSGGSLSSVVVSGTVATLTLTEGIGTASTAVGSFTVALAPAAGGVSDANGHRSSFTATAPLDMAAPAQTSVQLLDADLDGRVDRVTAAFSESLAAYSAANSPWTLTGTSSGGTLTSVAVTSSTATLTITEGVGAQDTSVGAMKITLAASATGIRDAAGNLSSFTSLTPLDKAKPYRVSDQFFDVDGDGLIDRIIVTFGGEQLAPYTVGTTGWAVTNVPSGGSLASVSVAGTTATLELTEGVGAPLTSIGSMRIVLAATAGGVRDAADNRASISSRAPTDKAPPVLRSHELRDIDFDGKVDRVVALFSETLSGTIATSAWTLTSVPSGGTLASVTRSGSTATLNITEGPSAADTTVGSMTVALAASATGVRDSGLNQASFTARSPVDRAGPAAATVTDTNGNQDGRAAAGDTLVVAFSEPLAAGTVPDTTSLTFADPVGTGSDTLAVAGITSGARSTGSDVYVTSDGTTATLPGTVALSADRRTVTVTVGDGCTGSGCGELGTATAAATFAFVPAATLQDSLANPAGPGIRSSSLRLF